MRVLEISCHSGFLIGTPQEFVFAFKYALFKYTSASTRMFRRSSASVHSRVLCHLMHTDLPATGQLHRHVHVQGVRVHCLHALRAAGSWVEVLDRTAV